LEIDVDMRLDQKFQTKFINFYADLEVRSVNMLKLAIALTMHVCLCIPIPQ